MTIGSRASVWVLAVGVAVALAAGINYVLAGGHTPPRPDGVAVSKPADMHGPQGATGAFALNLPLKEDVTMLPKDGGSDFNRLIHETSPYLLQHARNPVDWYPWGDEAFDAAKRQGKPIFLSVGYSTCHWCHVMERESFENDEVAAILNAHFIAIKVDREQRPDIDEIYMTATQLMTGRGGWPNSVWLTPDGRPWYAGTYFPREDAPGQAGFKTLLRFLADVWTTRRAEVDAQADQLTEAVKQASQQPMAEGEASPDDLLDSAIDELRQSFDETQGGFGPAPKFPPHGAIELLLREYDRTADASLLKMAVRTLDAMAAGGMHDHIGGGFHRYSTDARWFLPHFEKMLYDNAQLGRAYVDAYLLTGNEDYRHVAEGIYRWVMRDMTDTGGGFTSALDADSEGEEGLFYLWSYDEILAILGAEQGALFCQVYTIDKAGNYHDEATARQTDLSIPYRTGPWTDVAKAVDLPVGVLQTRMAHARRMLLDRRAKRVWPHLDDKVLTSWNGLMIGSLAHAGASLHEPSYIGAAKRAADFVLTRMRKDGRLLRSYRDGQAHLTAYLDDYAFLADGLLDLYDATGERQYLGSSRGLIDVLVHHYHDASKGGFFFTSDDHEALLLRTKDPFDKAIPAGNGIAAKVLVRLADMTGEPRYRDLAKGTFDAFAGLMQRAPRGAISLLMAATTQADVEADMANVATDQPDAQSQRGPVTIDAFASQVVTAPGQQLNVALRLTIKQGWHVNAPDPLQDTLIPTAVTVTAQSPAVIEHVAYPASHVITLGSLSEPIRVYTGTVWLLARVRVASDAAPGPAWLTFDVQAQPCDDTRCLLAQTHTLPIALTIGPGATSSQTRHREIFESDDMPATPTAAASGH